MNTEHGGKCLLKILATDPEVSVDVHVDVQREVPGSGDVKRHRVR